MLAGVQAQAEYEGQDGVPGGTSPSIGRPEAHRGNGRLHSYTRFDYISSNDAKGYNSRGASYQELKRYRETLIDYEKAIKLNPGNADVYEQRGHCYRLLDQHQEAIKGYVKVIELDSSKEWPHHYNGMAYRGLRQYHGTLQTSETYIELRRIESANWIGTEQVAYAYTYIGLAYIEFSQHQKAIERFDKALAINQNYTDANSGKEKATENLK